MYRLYWRDRELGTISGVVGDFPWMYGDFTPTAVDPAFREFFEFMSDEDAGEPSFDEALLDEANWWLIGLNGERRGIVVPAIRLDEGEIAWRWR